jgi:hypothetical protein
MTSGISASKCGASSPTSTTSMSAWVNSRKRPSWGRSPRQDLLDLVAPEREGELAGVLQHVARERDGEVEVQSERGIRVGATGGQARDPVDLLVGVAALAEEPLDRLDGPGLDRGEAVQLEGARMTSRKCCSTSRSAGRNSGKPLIGVTLAWLTVPSPCR